jgi:squalene-hopene/tetraprenyl-beta-curcumene cyclase
MPLDQLTDTVARARDALLRQQQPDGHWVFELEADATIPAEYVLLEHFLDRIEPELERKIGVYLRRIQGAHGGWPLFHDGAFDISASVKAYYALKLIGDDIDAPHMARARAALLAAGGAARTNVFTRAQLALFGQVPWTAVPVMPLELMVAPKWFPINLWRISYWSRTVVVPLMVLMHLRPRARNPRRLDIAELFAAPADQVRNWNHTPVRSNWGHAFRLLDRMLQAVEPRVPRQARSRLITRAVEFVVERLNGEDGLGGIYPAIANTVMMFDTLGYAPDHPHAATAWSAVRKLLVIRPDEAYCQPCLSPVWDTSLSGHAIAEANQALGSDATLAQACDWLRSKQIDSLEGDWTIGRPGVPSGGWAFQYENPHYPDVDDTAVVGMLLHRDDAEAHADSLARARDWIIGMQCRDGGWGAFDADNDFGFLNHIPFADHGALLDPPTADVTARCLSFLAQLGLTQDDPVVARGLAWLTRAQEPDGSWFGRWGTNYIYGTWSVLCALNACGLPHDAPAIRRAVQFLLDTQRDDGGWGEDEESYDTAPAGRFDRSTPSQTAWALLGLMAAGENDHPAVARGVEHLAGTQTQSGEWAEQAYTAVGFPRVFYLRYHGYKQFFPLLAVSRHVTLSRRNDRRVGYGL